MTRQLPISTNPEDGGWIVWDGTIAAPALLADRRVDVLFQWHNVPMLCAAVGSIDWSRRAGSRVVAYRLSIDAVHDAPATERDIMRPEIPELSKSTSDPWANRSKGMCCSTCMWHASKSEALGRCRRHAPTMSGYPAVKPDDWCGDHKLDETKI